MSGNGQGYGQMSGVNAGYGQGANPRTAWQGGGFGASPSMGGGFVPTPPVENYGSFRGMGAPGMTSFNPQYGAPMQQGGSVNNMGGGFERGVAKGAGMATGGGDPFVGDNGQANSTYNAAAAVPQAPMQGHRFSLNGDMPTSAPPPSSFLGAGGGASATGGVMSKIGGGPTIPQPIDVSQALANPPSWYPQGQYGPGPGQQDLPLTQNPNWRPNPGNVFDFSGFGRPR